MASFRGNNKPSSFLMFCVGDFSTKISIPAAFARERPDFTGQVSVTLTTTASDGSWDAKVKSIDGGFYLSGGWSDFAEENELTEMKLLIFHVNRGDSSAVRVAIFGHDSCLELPPPTVADRGLRARPWTFVKTLKKYNLKDQRMDLPKKFAVGTGISRSSEITLQDVEGRMWRVKITDRKRSMYNMSSGWVKFVKANKLKPKTNLLFEFVPGSNNVVKVSVV